MIKNIQIIGSLKVGGVEKVIENIFKTNFKQNHRFLVFDKKNKDDINLPIHYEVTYCNKNIFRYISVLFKSNYDIYNFWLIPTIFTSVLIAFKKKKIIWHIHNSDINLRTLSFKNYILVLINSFLSYFVPDKIIFCSQYSMDCYKNVFYCENKFLLIFNPINTQLLKNKKNFYNCSSLKMIMVANYTKAKDFKKLFFILSKIKNFQFKIDIYGRQILNNQKLLKQINFYHLNKTVNLLGFINTQNIYHRYDFKILVSKTESNPVSIVESLVSGTPVICSDVSDIKKIYNNKLIIIPKKIDNNFLNLINNLYLLRNDHIKYKNLSISGRNFILKKLNTKTIINKYSRLWSQLN